MFEVLSIEAPVLEVLEHPLKNDPFRRHRVPLKWIRGAIAAFQILRDQSIPAPLDGRFVLFRRRDCETCHGFALKSEVIVPSSREVLEADGRPIPERKRWTLCECASWRYRPARQANADEGVGQAKVKLRRQVVRKQRRRG